METIIIEGRREFAELPEKWYTDGTDEANEWKLNVCYWNPACGIGSSRFVGKGIRKLSNGADSNEYFEDIGHTYITPSEFLRLVYEPWKEGQKVKLPINYMVLFATMQNGGKSPIRTNESLLAHINACIKLTNIMNFANDAFEGDGNMWEICQSGKALTFAFICHPIRFTSKAAAEWAYKTFPEIFKAYWNV
jgi:hypothetical protein